MNGKMKKIILVLMLGIFLISLISAYDDQLIIPCGGDDELQIGCLGDDEINTLGDLPSDLPHRSYGFFAKIKERIEEIKSNFFEKIGISSLLFWIIVIVLIFLIILAIIREKKKKKKKERLK